MENDPVNFADLPIDNPMVPSPCPIPARSNIVRGAGLVYYYHYHLPIGCEGIFNQWDFRISTLW